MSTLTDDFWAPRASFLAPIPELAIAADQLDQAADAVLRGDLETARVLIKSCDMPSLSTYRALIAYSTRMWPSIP